MRLTPSVQYQVDAGVYDTRLAVQAQHEYDHREGWFAAIVARLQGACPVGHDCPNDRLANDEGGWN